MKYYHEEPGSVTGRSSYSIEEAKSSRAKCRKCKGKIEKGELRIGHHVDFFDGGDYPSVSWHHTGCFQLPKWFKKDTRDFYCDIITDNTSEKVLNNEDSLAVLLEREQRPTVYPKMRLEEARSGRMECTKCMRRIASGTLIIGPPRWVHIGCFTIPNHFNDQYNGETANCDFLANQVIDKTELNVLSTEYGLTIISEQMGSKHGLSKKQYSNATPTTRMKRKTRSTSASYKKVKV